MRARAFERELVRREREVERARVRAERDAERARLQQQKVAAKEAQLTEWRLEVEEHQERDQRLLGIAQDSPEVEDRDQFYAQLGERSAFQPAAFQAPVPIAVDEDRLSREHSSAVAAVDEAVAVLRVPFSRPLLAVATFGGSIGAIGLILAFRSDAGPGHVVPLIVGSIVAAVSLKLAQDGVSTQRAMVRKEKLEVVEREAAARRQDRVREAEAASRAAASEARRQYEEAIVHQAAEFDREEDERLAVVQRLKAGDVDAMVEALEAILPLDLPIDCVCKARVVSATRAELDLDLPVPIVLKDKEAKLLASGKPSYKEKSPKRLREEYELLVAALGLRHASEAMLVLPTCNLVVVRGWVEAIDPASGNMARRVSFEAEYDYPSLAPLTMDSIDARAALKHFRHRLDVA